MKTNLYLKKKWQPGATLNLLSFFLHASETFHYLRKRKYSLFTIYNTEKRHVNFPSWNKSFAWGITYRWGWWSSSWWDSSIRAAALRAALADDDSEGLGFEGIRCPKYLRLSDRSCCRLGICQNCKSSRLNGHGTLKHYCNSALRYRMESSE